MSRVLTSITSVADLVAMSGMISTDVELARLTMVWKAVESAVRRFVGYNIAQPADPYVDFLPENDWAVPVDPLLQTDYAYYHQYGNYTSGGPTFDAHLLQLRQGLVRSITEIRVDTGGNGGTSTADFDSSTILDDDLYYLDVDEKDPSNLLLSRTAFVVRKDASWPTRRRSVKVTYVAGLTAAELDDEYSDIRAAVCEAVLERYNSLSADSVGKVKAERLGDWSIQYAVDDNDGSSLPRELRSILQPFVSYRM